MASSARLAPAAVRQNDSPPARSAEPTGNASIEEPALSDLPHNFADIDVVAKQGRAPAARVNVWAAQQEARGSVCENPSPNPGRRGQGGWSIGINYVTLPQLTTTMRTRVGSSTVDRLAIECHGLAGSADIEGTARPPITAVRLESAVRGSASTVGFDIVAPSRPPYTLPSYQGIVNQLRDVARFLDQRSTVLFVGCLVGAEADGVALLRLLSGSQFFNCRVVGFQTLTAVLGGEQLNQGCTEPGTHVTNTSNPSLQAAQRIDDPSRRDYSGQNLPWADENAPHARVADARGNVLDRDTGQVLPPGRNTPDLPDPAAAAADDGWPDPSGIRRAAQQRERWLELIRRRDIERSMQRRRRRRR